MVMVATDSSGDPRLLVLSQGLGPCHSVPTKTWQLGLSEMAGHFTSFCYTRVSAVLKVSEDLKTVIFGKVLRCHSETAAISVTEGSSASCCSGVLRLNPEDKGLNCVTPRLATHRPKSPAQGLAKLTENKSKTKRGSHKSPNRHQYIYSRRCVSLTTGED